jgi:3-hydroxybutyryl-CoA dehydratase
MPYREADWIGRSAERRVRVSEALVDAFVDVSGDSSGIHVSDAAATARGFSGRVVHGLLLGALTSGVVGTQLPGDAGVLQEMKVAFRNPCYLDEDVCIRLDVTKFIESVQVLQMRLTITADDGRVLATGTVQSGLRAYNE